jgi:hypothetical protein
MPGVSARKKSSTDGVAEDESPGAFGSPAETRPTQQGVTYFWNQWERLIVPFRDDGRLEIDNGEPERCLRRVAQRRKAWLFDGLESGARRFAGELSKLVQVGDACFDAAQGTI